MIPKHAKLYSNGVKIAIFCKKLQTSHKMTPGLGRRLPTRRSLHETRLVAPVYSGRRLNEMFLIKFFKTWVQIPVFLSKILAAPLKFCVN